MLSYFRYSPRQMSKPTTLLQALDCPFSTECVLTAAELLRALWKAKPARPGPTKPGDLVYDSPFFGHIRIALAEISGYVPTKGTSIYYADIASTFHIKHGATMPYPFGARDTGGWIHTIILDPTEPKFTEVKLIRYKGPREDEVRSTVCVMAYLLLKHRLFRAGGLFTLIFRYSGFTNITNVTNLIRDLTDIKILPDGQHAALHGMCSGFALFVYHAAFVMLGMSHEIKHILPIHTFTSFPSKIVKNALRRPEYWEITESCVNAYRLLAETYSATFTADRFFI
jgi:hypothetical protein